MCSVTVDYIVWYEMKMATLTLYNTLYLGPWQEREPPSLLSLA